MQIPDVQMLMQISVPTAIKLTKGVVSYLCYLHVRFILSSCIGHTLILGTITFPYSPQPPQTPSHFVSCQK